MNNALHNAKVALAETHCITFTADRLKSALAALVDDVESASRQAARVGVPDGWKLVPVEPTWDMRNEGRELLIDGLEKEPERLACVLWKAMLAAAPSAPQGFPECSGNPASCPENEGYGCCKPNPSAPQGVE